MLAKFVYNLQNFSLRHFSIKLEKCILCGCPIQIKINNDEMAVRCLRCFASPVVQSLGLALKKHIPEISNKSVYELSSRGAFVNFLKKQKTQLTLSEYFDNIQTGTCFDGVLCQNVESLTFEDGIFDICTSLEVFEHVENDDKGFAEVYRVLKPKGFFLFTVPINLHTKTVERTQLINGIRKNTLTPEYHSDSLRGYNKVFCYRNYGIDILQRLKSAGFQECNIYQPHKNKLFGFGRPVIVAFKN